MSKPIGQREAAMRAQREENAKEHKIGFAKIIDDTLAQKRRADLAAKLPATSGKKPVKRKAKKRKAKTAS